MKLLNTLKAQMRAKMIKDFALLGIVFIVCFLLSAYFDAFEWLHEIALRYEDFEFDEFISASIILSFLFAIFSYRRWQDVKKISRYCEELSMIDPITMLPNRRLISRLLDDIRAGKNKQKCFPLSIILIDINGLEEIQLQMGHAVAEQAIHELVYRYSLLLQADQIISYRNANQCLVFCPELKAIEAQILCDKICNIDLEGRQTTLQLLTIHAVSVTLIKASEIDWAMERLEDLLQATHFGEQMSA